MTTALIVAASCLVIEAFFAAAELSVISSDAVEMRRLAQEGHRSAMLVDAFLNDKQRLLATTLLGTQLGVVVSTIVMTYALHQHRPEHAELYLIAVLTPTIIVFGEIVPKSLGQQLGGKMARGLVYPLWFASMMFSPAVWMLSRFSGWFARRLGVEERKLVTREELELLLRDNGKGSTGEITEGERKMISRIFAFSDKTVEDLMVPLANVTALAEEDDFEVAAREIEKTQYTRFPVYRDRVDHIVGTVHAFDLLKAGKSHARVGAIARAPIFVPKNQRGVDLLVELQRARQGMAIVVDEYGGTVGITTVEDILEEVVGPIDDEHDETTASLRREADGVWRVSARTLIRDVNRELKLDLPEGEDYESMAGLVLDKLKHIPREGESVRVGNATFKVMRATERAVEEIQIRVGKKPKVKLPGDKE